ncbi:hypothetical protein [Streptomyces sp. NPDC051662]|uniref:hypothetical protein n=1 Tax=Streptomyces sp. NPDC051662 TaxID=3154750 RepID=UPI00344001EB
MSTATDAAADDPDRITVPSCFVIGPIGDKYAEHGSSERRLYEESLRVYDEVVRAACREHGLSPLRADAIADTGEITDQIHRRLQDDDIVIADVSGGNPNVTYELGFRIGRGKPVILIGESGRLPFDIAQLRTIRFRRNESSLHEARDQLSRVLREGVTQGFRTAAYVGTTASGPSATNEADDEEVDDALGTVDLLAHAEQQMESATTDIEAMGEALLRIASVAEECTPEMDAANEAKASASARLALVEKFSTALAEPAAAFRASADAFVECMEGIEAGIHTTFDMIESLPLDERDEDSMRFLQQTIELVESIRLGTTHVTEFGAVIKTVVGYSRLLRVPGRDIAVAVRTVVSVAARIDSLERRARALLTASPHSTDCDTAPSAPALTHLTAS